MSAEKWCSIRRMRLSSHPKNNLERHNDTYELRLINMNLGAYVTRSARFWPNALALIYKDKRFTYSQFDQRTNRLAQGLLSLGLKPGDHVAIQSWNRPEIVETEVACYKAGMVKVPINARLSVDETIHVGNDSQAKAIILGSQHVEPVLNVEKDCQTIKHYICLESTPAKTINYEMLISESADINPKIDVHENDIAVLHYTSGTSGKLKAAMQTFGNRLAFIRKALMIADTRVERGDVFALIGPITHATGMNIMPVLFTGGCNLVLDRFDPELLLEAIAKEKVTHTFLVPTMINMLLDHPNVRETNFGSLKRLIYGAAPMSPSRVREAIEVFGPILVQGYGAGETTSVITVLTRQDHQEALRKNPERLASCGRPIFDDEVYVVDEDGQECAMGEIGEIIVRGPDIMKGYWNEPELTKEVLKDGWYHTGDLARGDDEGYLYIVDRKKEMIISGGFNIYPTEVESVLYSHSAVHEACVIGVPDDTWGESIKGVVVLKQNQKVSEAELIEHCTRSLASFKKPQSIDFVDELPKNPNGKIVRRVVQETFWRGRDRRVQ